MSTLGLEQATSDFQPEVAGLALPPPSLSGAKARRPPLAPGGLFLGAGAGGFTARSVP